VESVGLPTFLPTFSRELATDCLAPNKYPPPPPSKSPLIETPQGWHPPILGYGTHSSFLHIILHVWLVWVH